MDHAPPRIPGEHQRAYQAFCWWCAQSPRPPRHAAATEFRASKSTVDKWSSQWNWTERAAQADRAALEAQLARRDADREIARQRLVDALPDAIGLLLSIARGEAGPEGDQQPLLNRHGEEIGTRPVVSPTTRMRAAQDILDRAGLIIPKRMELTGPDGTEVKIRARHALSDLSGKQLAALAEAFGVET